MGGCVHVVPLSLCPVACHNNTSPSPALQPQPQPRHLSQAVLENTQRAEATFRAYIHTVHKQVIHNRGEITQDFQRVRDVLDASERQALTHFDAITANIFKALQAQANALQVKCHQISARMEAKLQIDFPVHPDLDSDNFPEPSVPAFNHAALHLLCDTIQAGKAWSFIHSQTPTCDIDLQIDRYHCTLLADMQQFIAQAKEDFGRRAFINHVASASTSFQNQCVATIPVENFNYPAAVGISISSDASLIAVLSSTNNSDKNHDKNHISVFSTATGNKLASFGSQGNAPGQFTSPTSFCFVPGTSNLMVADYGNWRLQEVTSTGEHVRFLGNSPKMAIDYYAVDANTKFVVSTTKKWYYASVFVIDYHTACHMKMLPFGVEVEGTHYSVKLTPDGTAVAVIDFDRPVVNILSLESGAVLKTMSFAPSTLYNIHFMTSGQYVVKTFRGNRWQASLVSSDCHDPLNPNPNVQPFSSTTDIQYLASVGNSVCVYRPQRKTMHFLI